MWHIICPLFVARDLSGLGWSLKEGHYDTGEDCTGGETDAVEELYERRQQRSLTMAEAGEMLGVSERTFRRWSGRYHAEGAGGLQDRRIGRLSARAVPVDEVLRMVTLYETRYTGWTVKHFHERWQQEHGGTRSYSWTKKTLQAAGHVTRAPDGGLTARSGRANPCRA